jgi:hypothetical protein
VFIPDPDTRFRSIAQKSTGSRIRIRNTVWQDRKAQRQECSEKHKSRDLVRKHKPGKNWPKAESYAISSIFRPGKLKKVNTSQITLNYSDLLGRQHRFRAPPLSVDNGVIGLSWPPTHAQPTWRIRNRFPGPVSCSVVDRFRELLTKKRKRVKTRKNADPAKF